MDVKGGLQLLVDELVEADVKADLDNSKLNPPCAWVHPGPIIARTLGDGYTMTAQVTLIAPNTSNVGNLDALSQLLTKALTKLEPDGPIETDAVVTIAGKNLPAFTFPIDVDL